ncbi:MAG: SDR family oxidoreductase [Gammaproteobacteria bacterium]|jgi:NAD(P)-dependent dehydrogenase (short-subunit alcohol dehydrogenase family)|nr:SDR family oxidoreductase [Gammaproteobacteria bacterium]
MRLEGKTMVVTGGAGVLGQAVAGMAKANGAEVVLLDVVPEFESPLGRVYCIDLTDEQAVAACFQEIGAVHAVANIAGGFDMGPSVDTTSDALWDELFQINVTTLRRVLAAAVPVMVAAGQGSIVNVGALGAVRGNANMGAYTAAKSTVMRLTEALSDEVKARGVNVNAVLPSLIDTPRNRADMPDADFSAWVAPNDLAAVICFLASDDARAVHGALVPVSGLS